MNRVHIGNPIDIIYDYNNNLKLLIDFRFRRHEENIYVYDPYNTLNIKSSNIFITIHSKYSIFILHEFSTYYNPKDSRFILWCKKND